ncbi:MAG: MBL fold metallo-hydrolase [Bacteroidota bacterium]
MSLIIASLNSGSNGNCYYIGNRQEAVLVDAGLTCRETENRLSNLGLVFQKIKAVFITHEHTDHTRGVEVIARKYKIPVYISVGTYNKSKLQIQGDLLRHFEAYAPVHFGALSVNAFPKLHDASDPHSFTVTGNGVTIGVLTDLGSVCEHVIQNFGKCHAAFLEANYDDEMLDKGHYPLFLKDRIRSDHGHLSNHQSLELFTTHKSEFMSHLLLSHLSQDNNNPRLVEDLFVRHAGNTRIAIASRHKESRVYHITGEMSVNNQVVVPIPSVKPVQMSLFQDND